MTPGEIMAALREREGWKRPELARRMNTSTQQIERLEKGQRKFSTEWLERAASALGVPSATFLDQAVVFSATASDNHAVSVQSNAAPFQYEGASLERMYDDLPIFGTALGAARYFNGDAIEQTELNSGDVVGYLKRPVMLNGRSDVYGLYVHGSSMTPVYPEGATLVAEMRRPPRIGDDVVVYLRPQGDDDDGQRARAVLVKRLVKRAHNWVELEQFNPAVTFRLDATEIVRIDRVMTLGDLLS